MYQNKIFKKMNKSKVYKYIFIVVGKCSSVNVYFKRSLAPTSCCHDFDQAGHPLD